MDPNPLIDQSVPIPTGRNLALTTPHPFPKIFSSNVRVYWYPNCYRVYPWETTLSTKSTMRAYISRINLSLDSIVCLEIFILFYFF